MSLTERWRRPAFDTNQAVPGSSRRWKVAELLNRASDTSQMGISEKRVGRTSS